jgi:hypothetical protein
LFVFKPKIPILVKFGGPWNRKCCYFYDLLEYFMAIWYNLQPFGIVCGHLKYFFRFGMFGLRKIWQPCPRRQGTKIVEITTQSM